MEAGRITMNETQKTLYFVKLYKFPFSKELSIIESNVFSVLFEMAKSQKDGVKATHSKILQVLPGRCSNAQLRSALFNLEKKGYLKIVTQRGRGASNIYKIDFSIIQKSLTL